MEFVTDLTMIPRIKFKLFVCTMIWLFRVARSPFLVVHSIFFQFFTSSWLQRCSMGLEESDGSVTIPYFSTVFWRCFKVSSQLRRILSIVRWLLFSCS